MTKIFGTHLYSPWNKRNKQEKADRNRQVDTPAATGDGVPGRAPQAPGTQTQRPRVNVKRILGFAYGEKLPPLRTATAPDNYCEVIRTTTALLTGKSVETTSLTQSAPSETSSSEPTRSAPTLSELYPSVRSPRLDLRDRFTVAGKTYRYGDPSTHGIKGTLSEHGFLSFMVEAQGDKATLGGGRDMYVSMMGRMKLDGLEPRIIEGSWVGGTNLDQYFENLQTMPPLAAAGATWSGRMAAEFGYTQVTMPFRNDKTRTAETEIYVQFSKPTGTSAGQS